MSQVKNALRADGFTFRQFFVAHDRCAMKVGTDGVLLGAWAPVAGVRRILDIGTGSGLLALMLAQRTSLVAQQNSVLVDAVEIDSNAAEQAQENVWNSPWQQRIQVICADVLQWQWQQSHCYDLIISNPPYFPQGAQCATAARNMARYTTCLDHQQLLDCATKLITQEGLLFLILPQDIGNILLEQAQQQGWHCRLRTDVFEQNNRPPHRVLLALSLTAGEMFADYLTIRDTNHHYSAAYCSLTRDFYLFR